MSELEAFVVQTASGIYRWQSWDDNGYSRAREKKLFESGDAIKINPFPDQTAGSMALWPIFGEFLEYATDDIAKVYIPEKRNNRVAPVWFNGDEGEYLIHRGYIQPQ